MNVSKHTDLALYHDAAEITSLFFIFSLFLKMERWAAKGCPSGCLTYFSTISSSSIGHALTQMPQAMHLEAGPSSGRTHHLHGAGLGALAAADALLLVDHVHAGLGVLGDGLVLTGTHTLAALNAGIGLCAGTLGHDADTALLLVKFLIERLGTGGDALQTCHALHIFLAASFFIAQNSPSFFCSLSLYMSMQEKSNKNFRKSDFAELSYANLQKKIKKTSTSQETEEKVFALIKLQKTGYYYQRKPRHTGNNTFEARFIWR